MYYHYDSIMPFRGGRNGRMYIPGMHGGNYQYEGDMSSEEMEERKAFEENMGMYEVQDQSSFPTLPVSHSK